VRSPLDERLEGRGRAGGYRQIGVGVERFLRRA